MRVGVGTYFRIILVLKELYKLQYGNIRSHDMPSTLKCMLLEKAPNSPTYKRNLINLL